jgi:hypothetical protein
MQREHEYQTLTNDNVWRHPSCSNGTYKSQNGLRFLSSSAKAQNLVDDFFELFQNPAIKSERLIDVEPNQVQSQTGIEVFFISYHAAVVALHHATACALLTQQRLHECMPDCILEWIQQATCIERPLSLSGLLRTRAKVVAHATHLSALQTYQRTRTIGGGMIAILAKQFGSGPVRGNLQGVNCKAVHLILRRASGSYKRMKRVASPYTPRCVNISKQVSDAEFKHVKSEMKRRFDDHAPTQLSFENEAVSGPVSFHVSEYYANKCIRLMECDHAEQKWAELETKVQRVRRGELTVYDVLFDPSHDYWVYSIHYTYYLAIKKQLEANTRWTNIPPVDTMSKMFKCARSIWHSPYSSNSGIRISKGASRYEQTTQMVHILYAFIRRTERVLSDKFSGVFGYNEKFKYTILMRLHHLSTVSGDEVSALMMGNFMPFLMTPELHLDIAVTERGFQMDTLYLQMSNETFGKLKNQFKHVIPFRHNGFIARTMMLPGPGPEIVSNVQG